MSRQRFSSWVLTLVTLLCVLNLGLLVLGVNWAHEVFSELSEGSEDESLVSAATTVERAHSTVQTVVRALIWGAVLFAVAALIVTLARQSRRAAREAKASEIRSYTRNLARARKGPE